MIRRRTFISRYGKPRATRARTGNEIRALRQSCTCAAGHKHDLRLDARCCDDLHLRQRAGEIRGLRTQVTHALYVGASGSYCDCHGIVIPPHLVKAERVRAVRLDFQFEERTAPRKWEVRYGDAKGWIDTGSAQYLAYKIFAILHGQEIQLYRKSR